MGTAWVFCIAAKPAAAPSALEMALQVAPDGNSQGDDAFSDESCTGAAGALTVS
jgi:hypothetical protein